MLNYMLSQQIRELRLAKKLSQVEMAKRLGVTKQCICNWENDNIQPSVEMLVRLASFFSVSVDYLLGLEPRDSIEVQGLTPLEIAHIRQLVDDLRQRELSENQKTGQPNP